MFVDVIYPGGVPFDGLGGSDNVTCFINITNKIMKTINSIILLVVILLELVILTI